MIEMLTISNLSVFLKGKIPIIKNISLSIPSGSVHAIMGPNGSGKSTLALTLIGHPDYQVAEGSIILKGEDITALSVDNRAKRGLFLSFQHPYALPGVSVFTFLKEAVREVSGEAVDIPLFHKKLEQAMIFLGMDPLFIYRDVNEGFSGGEKKRLEMLQLMMLQPSLAILDEIDSGLDIDALTRIKNALTAVREQNPSMSIIIITHYPRLLHYIMPDRVHIMKNGSLICSGDTSLATYLEENGYDDITEKEKFREKSPQ